MTVVVAYKTEDKIILGADSQTSRGNIKNTMLDSKIFKVYDVWYCFSGTNRIMQILKHHSINIICPPSYTPMEHLIENLIPMWREVLSEQGAQWNENGCESYNSEFIVVIQGEIFLVDSLLSITSSTLDYTTAGSGGEIALGSVFTSLCDDYAKEADPEQTVKTAIYAAMEFNTGCGGRVDIVTINLEGNEI